MSLKITTPELHPQDQTNTTVRKQQKERKEAQEAPKDVFIRTRPAVLDVYNKLGQIRGVHKNHGNLLERFQQIKNSVEQQMDALFSSFTQSDENKKLAGMAKDELGNYFKENPQALKEIADGKMPEYWNMQNTASRMFDIVTAGYSGKEDLEGFYNKALDFVHQAYDEVQLVIGFDFPPLVKDTKEALLNGLEQLKDGVSIDEISFA